MSGMLSRLLSGARRTGPDPADAPPPRAPRPVFAVGDVHGMAGLLDRTLAQIEARIARKGLSDAAVVFLGDHIDRGPDARETLDLLMEAPARLGVETVFLRGNHEAFAVRFLDRPEVPTRWLDFGGDTTVESYGIDPHDYDDTAEGRAALSAALAEAMGPAHRRFLREALVTHHDAWPYFFSHAGIDPDLPPGDQPAQALVHGKPGFRKRGGWEGGFVVHGHFATDTPDFGPRRLGVDTGAYRSGVLTTAHCHDRGISFMVAAE